MFFPQNAKPYGVKRVRFKLKMLSSGFALKLCPISMLTLPSHYGKSLFFPCVRLLVVALATTRAIHIFNGELL